MIYDIICHVVGNRAGLGGSYLYCVLDRYTRRTRTWQWNWQLTDCFIESRFIQNTPVWHITKKAGNRIPRCRIVLHGAQGWGLLIKVISFIIAVPTSRPIFVTAVRCSTRNRNCRAAQFHSFAERYRIRYGIRYGIRHRIQYHPFFYGLPYRRSKMTYNIVGPKHTISNRISYTKSYNNLRYRRSYLLYLR